MNCLDESNPNTKPSEPDNPDRLNAPSLCMDCGEPISARILERRPSAKRCSTCCIRAMFGR